MAWRQHLPLCLSWVRHTDAAGEHDGLAAEPGRGAAADGLAARPPHRCAARDALPGRAICASIAAHFLLDERKLVTEQPWSAVLSRALSVSRLSRVLHWIAAHVAGDGGW